MAERFNPYHVWLGIPLEEQPPNHYRLLGIPVFESDPEVVTHAYERQMAHVKVSALGPHGPESQQILNELAFAQICLLDKDRKAKYDVALYAAHGYMGPMGGRSEGNLPKIAEPPEPAHKGRKGEGDKGREGDREAGREQDREAGRERPGCSPSPLLPLSPSPLPPLAVPGARQWIVGRSPACDFIVTHTQISERHCRLTWEERYTYLEDLDSAHGTFVNGQRLTARIPVCKADKILMAGLVPIPWPAQIPVVKERLIRIGAGPDNDVVLDFPMISWRHAVIRVSNDPAVLEDLGSTNGTALGSRTNKIETCRVTAKDTVFFGSYEIPAAKLFAAIREILGRAPAQGSHVPVGRREG